MIFVFVRCGPSRVEGSKKQNESDGVSAQFLITKNKLFYDKEQPVAESGEATVLTTYRTKRRNQYKNSKDIDIWRYIRFLDHILETHTQRSIWGPFTICRLGKTTQEYKNFLRSFLLHSARQYERKVYIISTEIKSATELYTSFDEELPLECGFLGKFNTYLNTLDRDEKYVVIHSQNLIAGVKLLRSTLLVIQDIEPNLSFPIRDFEAFLAVSCFAWTVMDFVPNAKFFTAYPLAKYLNDILPNKPKNFLGHPLVFGGSIKKWLKNRLTKQNTKEGNISSLHLWFSFLQGIKRGCHTVPFEYIEKAYLDHEGNMLKDSGMIADVNFKQMFRSQATEFCSAFKPKEFKLYQPSSSSHLESSIKEGGGLGEIKKQLALGIREADLLLEEIFPSNPISEVLTYDTWSGELIKTCGFILGKKQTEMVREAIKLFYPEYLKVIPIEDWAPEMGLIVEAVAIAEPLKVRMITKGEALPYWWAKHMQRLMWDYLGNFPQFQLTREVLTLNHLRDLMVREIVLEGKHGIFLNFDSFVSGDYSAATDNLKAVYTIEAFEAFLVSYAMDYPLHSSEDAKNLIFDINIFRAVLYRSFVKYPDGHMIYQRNGQLMGSPLSFPILCLVNLISYKMALEEYTECKFTFKELPVLVNGDDILFRTNDAFYPIWLRHIKEVGFNLSIGKNYVSSTFLSINSLGFRYEVLPNVGSVFIPIPYINVGLLVGQSKLSCRERSETLPITDWYNRVIEGSTSKLKSHNLFLHYHKERIEKITLQGLLNLFINPTFGGIGFKNPMVRVHYTDYQRKLASFMLNKRREFKGSFKELKQLNLWKIVFPNEVIEIEDKRQFSIQVILKPDNVDPEEEKLYSYYSLQNFKYSSDFLLWSGLDQGPNSNVEELELKVIFNKRLIKSFEKSIHLLKPMSLDQLDLNYITLRTPHQQEYSMGNITKYHRNTFDDVFGLELPNNLQIGKKYLVEFDDSNGTFDFTYDWLNYNRLTNGSLTEFQEFSFGLHPIDTFRTYVEDVVTGGERWLNPTFINLYTITTNYSAV